MGELLNKTIAELNKIYGSGTVQRLDIQSPIDPTIKSIPTGSLKLDYALGVGGIPIGRIIEIFGPESSGKTTLTLHMVVEAQKQGKICSFIDSEHALDLSYAQKLGIQLDKLIISQPDNGEQALEILDKLLGTNELGIIVVDSVAALTPKAEIDGEMGEQKVGLQARLMSQAMRKIVGKLSKSGSIVIFTNQLRDRIGITWGDPSVTTGGKALKFYATIRLDVRRISSIKEKTENGEVIGNDIKIKVVKNKVAPPYREVETRIIFGRGIDKIKEILDLALEYEIIKMEGVRFFYKEVNLGETEGQVLSILDSNPELLEELTHFVLISLGLIELTEEEKKKLEEEEKDRKWKNIESRIVSICEKYRYVETSFLSFLRGDNYYMENWDYYKKLTDYAISREIKKHNEEHNIEVIKESVRDKFKKEQ